MRLEDTSNDFRTFFILKFTKEILKHSIGEEMFQLGAMIKQKQEHEQSFNEKIKQKLPPALNIKVPFVAPVKPIPKESIRFGEYSKSRDIGNKRINVLEEKPFEEFHKGRKTTLQKPIVKPAKKLMPPLKIPRVQLPPHLQNIQPISTKVKLDLGKLEPLVNDMMVRAIECNGPKSNVFVLGRMGRKKATITLSKDDIEFIINSFSEHSKIPISDGVYRVAVGNLVLSAIISSVSEPRFIISKINPMQNF